MIVSDMTGNGRSQKSIYSSVSNESLVYFLRFLFFFFYSELEPPSCNRLVQYSMKQKLCICTKSERESSV